MKLIPNDRWEICFIVVRRGKWIMQFQNLPFFGFLRGFEPLNSLACEVGLACPVPNNNKTFQKGFRCCARNAE